MVRRGHAVDQQARERVTPIREGHPFDGAPKLVSLGMRLPLRIRCATKRRG
jgi:hypothetical protein